MGKKSKIFLFIIIVLVLMGSSFAIGVYGMAKMMSTLIQMDKEIKISNAKRKIDLLREGDVAAVRHWVALEAYCDILFIESEDSQGYYDKESPSFIKSRDEILPLIADKDRTLCDETKK